MKHDRVPSNTPSSIQEEIDRRIASETERYAQTDDAIIHRPLFPGQHALQGWCPPLPLFRKMGIRTRKEMDAEKYTLLAVLRNRKSTTR